MKDPKVFLFEIVAFCDEVVTFTAGLSEDDFHADRRTQRAVSYCLLSIGEAVNRLQGEHPGFLDANVSPDLPWADLVGMRHFLAHGYDRVDPVTLFEVSRTGVPELRDLASTALARLTDQE